MNKKSNVIIGASAVGVIGLAILGMSMIPKEGKGNEVVERQVAVEVEAPVAIIPTESGEFVASKQGKKYFPVDCGTAKAIKEENKVFFGSESEAQAAGYERSLTCK